MIARRSFSVPIESMTELLRFGETGFDVEDFINDACARKPENESMDRYDLLGRHHNRYHMLSYIIIYIYIYIPYHIIHLYVKACC
jgi:hypothetical protein